MLLFVFPQKGTTKLIYAFHPDDPSSEDNIPPHDFRSKGARSVYLLNTLDNVPKLPDDTKTFNFTVNKVKLLRPKQPERWFLDLKVTPNHRGAALANFFLFQPNLSFLIFKVTFSTKVKTKY